MKIEDISTTTTDKTATAHYIILRLLSIKDIRSTTRTMTSEHDSNKRKTIDVGPSDSGMDTTRIVTRCPDRWWIIPFQKQLENIGPFASSNDFLVLEIVKLLRRKYPSIFDSKGVGACMLDARYLRTKARDAAP